MRLSTRAAGAKRTLSQAFWQWVVSSGSAPGWSGAAWGRRSMGRIVNAHVALRQALAGLAERPGDSTEDRAAA
jgi:hypothetical protein